MRYGGHSGRLDDGGWRKRQGGSGGKKGQGGRLGGGIGIAAGVIL